MPRKGKKSQRGRAERAQADVRAEAYELEFYEANDGTKPVLRWIKEDLSPTKRRAIGMAMREILQAQGVGVCGSPWGKQLGGGIFEFRLRMEGTQVVGVRTKGKKGKSETITLRVFCHAYGDKVILLLAGYDKGQDPSPSRQQKELAVAKKRLTKHQKRRE